MYYDNPWFSLSIRNQKNILKFFLILPLSPTREREG
jgi:hypothetical protein